MKLTQAQRRALEAVRELSELSPDDVVSDKLKARMDASLEAIFDLVDAGLLEIVGEDILEFTEAGRKALEEGE